MQLEGNPEIRCLVVLRLTQPRRLRPRRAYILLAAPMLDDRVRMHEFEFAVATATQITGIADNAGIDRVLICGHLRVGKIQQHDTGLEGQQLFAADGMQ